MSLILFLFTTLQLGFCQSPAAPATQAAPLANGQLQLRHNLPGRARIEAESGARSQSALTSNDAVGAVQSGAAEAAAYINTCRGTPPAIPPDPGACQLILDFQRGMNQAALVVNPSDRLRAQVTARNFTASDLAQMQAALNQVAGYQDEIVNNLDFTINPDGSLVSPDGTVTLPANFLQPNADLLSYGLTQEQIDQLFAVASNLATNGLDYSLVESAPLNGNSRLPASNPTGSQAILQQLQNIPDPSAIQTGGTLGTSEDAEPEEPTFRRSSTVNFRGTPIGPANGNVFRSINDAYNNAGLYRSR